MFDDVLIWVRGAGEMGSAVAHILKRTGFRVIISELPYPLAIRRTVTFSDAVFGVPAEVEGITARRTDADSTGVVSNDSHIPLYIDDPEKLLSLKPDIVVDGRMLKDMSESFIHYAPFTIGLGTGFIAQVDCHIVIETMRGHTLGRIFKAGSALPDTKTPAELGGESLKRVIYAEGAGKVEWKVGFGDLVTVDDIIGRISNETEITAPISGIVRGLISPHTPIAPGAKIGDIDPRGKDIDFRSISDKACSIGRGVLEAVLIYTNSRK